MRKPTLFTILLLAPVLVWPQTNTSVLSARTLTPTIKTINYKLGDDFVPIRIYQYGDSKDYFFINLHDDEVTAVKGAMKILETKGGTLIRLVNFKQRNITFSMQGSRFTFDPNRIFSSDGIYRTLGNFGWRTDRAMEEVKKFAERIVSLLPQPPACIIALHNNSDGKYSVTSYLNGHERKKDASEVHLGTAQDADDLFLTTDSSLFQRLTKEKFNAVLQDNDKAFKDGSLSIYCGEKKLRYLNCETEHGKLKQYTDMLALVLQYLKKEEIAVTVYKYRLYPNTDSVRLTEACDIYFGEKRIGGIHPGTGQNEKSIGRIEIHKSFTLYDNMDFYYFPVGNNRRKVELRVDPTRNRKLVEAGEIIPIKIMQ